jgi:hypothetical protein
MMIKDYKLFHNYPFLVLPSQKKMSNSDSEIFENKSSALDTIVKYE